MDNPNPSRLTSVRLYTAAVLLVIHYGAVAAVRYVNDNSANPTSPYTNWSTAARTIQDAVDAAVAGDEIVVTNGIYATGGRATDGDSTTNRVAVGKPLSLRSMNGPQFTTVDGGGTARCVYLTNGASLSGFALTNGFARYGGGLLCESTNAVASNCVVSGNSAGSNEDQPYAAGGGVYGGTLNNCLLTGNLAFRVDGWSGDVSGSGGGASGCILNDCTIAGNWSVFGGGVSGCALNNCVLRGNRAEGDSVGVDRIPVGSGGGASGSTLNNCTVTGNFAGYGEGGGTDACTLNNCTLTGNTADVGGGASGGTLNNCTLRNNQASGGGGAVRATLNNCTLSANSTGFGGGGVSRCTLNNCALTGNSAGGGHGGGAAYSTLNNCTLTGNSGDGAFGCALTNCIAYFNTGLNYDRSSTLSYCCTTPQPTNGVGNISLDPQLADYTHLSASSPCRAAGNTASATGTDIDGEPWARPPSIGCDEYCAGSVAGPLGVGVATPFTNVAVGFSLQLTALIEGRATANSWDFGDGEPASNEPFASHAWTAPGDYTVVLRAYNDSQPDGISATVTVHVVTGVHYVTAASASAVAPYTSWATAATTIQAAVDAAEPGALVVVTNGNYALVEVSRPHLTLRSVNGPLLTTINGGGSNVCVVLADGCTLSGFTITNGSGGASGGIVNNCTLTGNGGGADSCILNNCKLTGNFPGGGAVYSTLNNCTLTDNSTSGDGGGTYECTLNNCTLRGNSAARSGGGAAGGTLNNCILIGNSADYGGGTAYSTLDHCILNANRGTNFAGGAAYCTLNSCALTENSTSGLGRSGDGGGGGAAYCTLNNCTLTHNFAPAGPVPGWNLSAGGYYCTFNNCIVYSNTSPIQEVNYDDSSLFSYSCTMPLPNHGFGNITNAPLFQDLAGGNLRLQSNSPCINAGRNALAPAGPDLDGNPRIRGGTVDIGAYEFQSPTSLISYAWLQQYGLPTDGSADFADPDGDGMNNWQEWRCGTDPTNALSALRLLAPSAAGTNVTVTWQSVAGVSYLLERATNLSVPLAFTSLATNIPGQSGTTTYVDTNSTRAGPLFYRVGVNVP
jgi:hypothetical protein